MHRFTTAILNMLFPPTKEAALVATLTPEHGTELIHIQSIGNTTALTRYNNPSIRALIHEAKFHRNTHALTLLGTIVATYVSLHPFSEDVVIIPIPLSRERFTMRGYNQVSKILTLAGIDTFREDILIRTRNSAPQTTMGRAHREKNVHDVFAVSNSHAVTGKHVCLVDDVLTTGATLQAASTVLRKYEPASITAIVFAH
jgi:ComF family protein